MAALLRLTFVITRKPDVPPKLFEDLICEPALHLDLGGRFQYEGSSKYTVIVEGNKRKVEHYRTYIQAGACVMGETSHFTEFTPTARVFPDYMAVNYNIQRRGTQRNIDEDVTL